MVSKGSRSKRKSTKLVRTFKPFVPSKFTKKQATRLKTLKNREAILRKVGGSGVAKMFTPSIEIGNLEQKKRFAQLDRSFAKRGLIKVIKSERRVNISTRKMKGKRPSL